MGHTGHGQVHTDLGALALEVLTQAGQDLLVHALGHAHHVLGSPGLLSGLLLELLSGGLADGAELRGGLALEHVTADGADKLLHNNFLLIVEYFGCFLPVSYMFGIFHRRSARGAPRPDHIAR